MIILISPAKTLDFDSPAPSDINMTKVGFQEEASELISLLRPLSPAQLQSLMKISAKLADLNYNRFQQWSAKPEARDMRPALLAFKGDVYTGLDAASLSKKEMSFAQDHLRILSGLYGILKPLDAIQPYRLEMGTKLENPDGKNLYDFWGGKIAQQILSDLEETNSGTIINLASNEYFKAVKNGLSEQEIVTPVFKDYKNGQYKVISFFAKKARGLMTRFIIKNKINKAADLKHFEENGYFYNDKLSKGQEIVFTRG